MLTTKGQLRYIVSNTLCCQFVVKFIIVIYIIKHGQIDKWLPSLNIMPHVCVAPDGEVCESRNAFITLGVN